MKNIPFCYLVLALAAMLSTSGCAPMSVATRYSDFSPTMGYDDVMEITIETAREVNFPPATKIDKTNGIVEFGSYGLPELGITAQVRIRSEDEIEITVRRGSVYVPFGVDKKADEFATKLRERLEAAGSRSSN